MNGRKKIKKSSGIEQTTVRQRWQMLMSATEFIFTMYNLTNPIEINNSLNYGIAPGVLERLVKNGFIEEYEGKYELSQTLCDFLDALADISGEANTLTIKGNKDILDKNLLCYKSAKNDGDDPQHYLTTVRKNLKTILNNIKKTLTAIDYTVKDTYMVEHNIRRKIEILNDNRDKMNELENIVMNDVAGIWPYVQTMFSLAQDDEQLQSLGTWFKHKLSDFYSTRTSIISKNLRDYLDKFEKIDKSARKIEQIYRLWSHSQLKGNSDVESYTKSIKPRIQKPRDLNFSLDKVLRIDDNKNIIAVVRRLSFADDGLVTKKVAKGIRRTELNKRPPAPPQYNIYRETIKFFKDYKKNGSCCLLAEYAAKYNGYSKELTLGEKICIFAEAANLFRSELAIEDAYVVITDGNDAYKCKKIKLK